MESGESIHARWAAASARGRSRARGEDAFGAFEDVETWVVADGCVADGGGGRSPSGAAARIAVASIGALGSPADPSGRSSMRAPPIDPIAAAIEEAHRRVRDAAPSDRIAAGMGATMAVLRLTPPWASIARIGDCRVGRVRDGALEWLALGDALAERPLANGASLEGAREASSARSTVIGQALGVAEALEIELLYLPLAPGDAFVLCTDGFWRTLDPAQIAAALADRARSIADRCAALFASSALARAEDDASAVLVELAPTSSGA